MACSWFFRFVHLWCITVIKVSAEMEPEDKMGEEEPAKPYPLKSLHDFLTELDREWDKFKTGSLIGMVTSGVLLVFLVSRFLALLVRIRRLRLAFGEFAEELLFLVLVAIFVGYEIYLLLAQYRFFRKWERRVGLLIHLEERLMGELERKNEASGKGLEEAEKKPTQGNP